MPRCLHWFCPDLTDAEARELAPYLTDVPTGRAAWIEAVRQWLPVVRAGLGEQG